MHLADAFIQSIVYTFFYQYVCSLGIEPTTFALLKKFSTTEPQEHYNLVQNVAVARLIGQSLCDEAHK